MTTRRDFLKTGAAGVALAAAGRTMAAHGQALTPVKIGAVEQRGCGGIGHEDSKLCLSSLRTQGPITTGCSELSADSRDAHLTTR